jgi:peptide/nickel transport system ATP-binding protein
VLAVDNLSKGFGETRLFQNLSFGIREGEVVAVTGPSGCGKTTLGHMVIGIETASEGSVHWHSPMRACQRQKLYQDPPAAFAPRRLLRMAIQDLINRHRLDWTQVHELMTELSLAPALLDRLPTEVSGGELQRIALIRVLLLRPSLVFADEPTSRLDPLLQQQTMRLIVDYAQRQRFAVLLVTHDPDLATRSAHRTLTGLFDNSPS